MALDPGRAISQLVVQRFTNENGLPQNSVQALCQTADGYIWIGTQDGLARFDGARFVVFDKTSVSGFPNNVIWGLSEARAGGVWVATNGGAARLVEGRLADTIGTREGVQERTRAAYEDRIGTLWVGTDGGGVARISGRHLVKLGTADRLPSNRVRAIVEDAAGHLYIGTSGGLVGWTKDGLSRTTIPAPLDSRAIGAIAPARDGGLWVGLLGGGLARLRDGTVRTWGAAQGLPSESVWAVLEDRDRNVWIGTEGGLARLGPGGQVDVARDSGLTERVWALLEDREGGVWVGGDGGAIRLSTGKVLAYTTKDGLLNDSASSVLEDRSGRVFIGTNAGLALLSSGRVVRTFTKGDGLPSDRVWSLAEGSDGSIFAGTDAGVSRLDSGGKLSTVPPPEGTVLTRIRALAEYDGALWVGTLGGGVVRLPVTAEADAGAAGRDAVAVRTKDGLATDQVRALLPARGGGLWIGQTGGLSLLADGRMTTYTRASGMPSDLVTCLVEDEDGALWIGTYGGGLLRFANGKFRAFTTRDGLHNDVVLTVLLDAVGGLWMSSGKGISRVAKADLDALTRGTVTRVTSRVFGRAEGMPNPDCNGGSQPSGWRARDGRLWFPTVQGVVVVDPTRIPVNSLPPPVLVEEVLADQSPLPLPEGRASGQPLTLAAGTDSVEIRYSAASFNAPQNVRFRYYLEGYDRSLHDAGTRRVAYYTNLPPREYVFHVEACNEDGVWNERGASLGVSLTPFFYETGWFRIAVVGLLALAALGAYRLRVRTLTRRAEELDRLVREKTKSLEDAQEKIARLAESAGRALLDMRAWAQGAAVEIAKSVGAKEIGVFLLEKETLSPLLMSGARTPTLAEVRRAPSSSAGGGEDETIVPVEGISGETLGALLVVGKSEGAWDDGERRLIGGFAHQLGSALEVQRLRRDLEDARARRAATRKEMLDRGVDLLQVCPACHRCYDQEVSRCLVDSAALDGSTLLPFRIEGRYRLARLVGQGGMGTVFEARDERLDREVALKILRADCWDKPDARLRFEQEARTIARVGHTGVVGVHDSGELPDGSAFIVMELLRGKDLAQVILHYGRGTPLQVAALLREGAAAIGAAHAAGVIHRDLKPANVFLVPKDRALHVKILDFGLAKTISIDTVLTRAGMIVGTPSFMSPEQLLGEEVGPESDVYSFAALAFEALVGRPHVSGGSFAEVCAEVLNGPPRRPSDILAEVPGTVDRAFDAAFRREPHERPSDIAAWVASFVSELESMPCAIRGWPSSFPDGPTSEGPDLQTRAMEGRPT